MQSGNAETLLQRASARCALIQNIIKEIRSRDEIKSGSENQHANTERCIKYNVYSVVDRWEKKKLVERPFNYGTDVVQLKKNVSAILKTACVDLAECVSPVCACTFVDVIEKKQELFHLHLICSNSDASPSAQAELLERVLSKYPWRVKSSVRVYLIEDMSKAVLNSKEAFATLNLSAILPCS